MVSLEAEQIDLVLKDETATEVATGTELICTSVVVGPEVPLTVTVDVVVVEVAFTSAVTVDVIVEDVVTCCGQVGYTCSRGCTDWRRSITMYQIPTPAYSSKNAVTPAVQTCNTLDNNSKQKND